MTDDSDSIADYCMTEELDEREIAEREKFKRKWLKDHDDLRKGLKKIPVLSKPAVRIPNIVIDTRDVRALIDKTKFPFAGTPEKLAERLTKVLRWYAIDQQPSEAPSRKQLQGITELPNDVLRHPRMLQVVIERMSAFVREAVMLDEKPGAKTKRRMRKLLNEIPEGKGGRPPNRAFSLLVVRLADIYEECTGRKAGVSRNLFGKIGGPFVRFVVATIDLSNPPLPHLPRDIPRAILVALQARKKSP